MADEPEPERPLWLSPWPFREPILPPPEPDDD